jgi:hypothetical protein
MGPYSRTSFATPTTSFQIGGSGRAATNWPRAASGDPKSSRARRSESMATGARAWTSSQVMARPARTGILRVSK